MSTRPELEKARALARDANPRYPELKRECERRVVRWEWGTFVLHSLEPAYFEIHKVRPGTKLRGEPTEPTSGVHGYGFDDAGRLVVERQLTEFPGKYYETFYLWESAEIARFHYHYDPRKPWINVAWLSFDEAGRVRAIDTVYARGNYISDTYTYDREGRLLELERRGTNPPYGDLHDYRDVEYDEIGRIARVYGRSPDGRRVLDFERPTSDRTFAALRTAIADGLVAAFVTSLEKQAIEGPVFGVALHFCGADHHHRLPPNVSIGLEADRARILEEYGEDASDSIENPAEWETSLEWELDEDLASMCASASQDIWQRDLHEEADRFVRDLARRLDEGASALPLSRTEDFAVKAVDLDA